MSLMTSNGASRKPLENTVVVKTSIQKPWCGVAELQSVQADTGLGHLRVLDAPQLDMDKAFSIQCCAS